MNTKLCLSCKKEVFENENTCPTCNFPFNGTEKEKAIHIGKFINQKSIVSSSEDSILKVRNILFLIAAIQLLGLGINLYKGHIDIVTIVVYLILALTFISCGVLIKKSPILFITFPLCLLLALYFIEYLTVPSLFFRGIIFKVLIIGIMIYSIYIVIKSNQFKKKHTL